MDQQMAANGNETTTGPAITVDTPSELKAAAAAKTGQDQSGIGSIIFQLDSLRENGILVNITVGGSTLFSRRASLAELGIPKKSLRGENTTAGSRFMGPRKFVSRQASMSERIRSLGDRYGQEVTGFKPYRYIFWRVYDEFKEKWDALEAEFYNELRQEAIDNLEAWRIEYIETCQRMAIEAWDAMANGTPELTIHLRKDRKKTFANQQEFITWIVGRAEGRFPSEMRVRTMMRALYTTAVLLSDADIEAERARGAREMADAAESHAQQSEAHARTVKANQDERVAKSEAELKMQAIRQAELEHARHQLTQIVSPFEELFNNLRAQVYADAKEIAASIRKNGFLNPQVGKRIERLVELFKMKDATDDHQMTSLLEAVQTWAKGTPKQTGKSGKVTAANPTTLASLSKALGDVVEAAHDSAIRAAKRANAALDLENLEI